MNDKGPPSGWGDDDLTSYFELVYRNRFATFANKRPVFDRLIAIDSCYMSIAKDWLNPKKLVETILFSDAMQPIERHVNMRWQGKLPVCFHLCGYASNMLDMRYI